MRNTISNNSTSHCWALVISREIKSIGTLDTKLCILIIVSTISDVSFSYNETSTSISDTITRVT